MGGCVSYHSRSPEKTQALVRARVSSVRKFSKSGILKDRIREEVSCAEGSLTDDHMDPPSLPFSAALVLSVLPTFHAQGLTANLKNQRPYLELPSRNSEAGSGFRWLRSVLALALAPSVLKSNDFGAAVCRTWRTQVWPGWLTTVTWV